ncbi:MAG TPA: hypothetical protein VFE68_02805 [Vicinamibacteria bacterium]|jgi:hypothetical protein|nr:hypothetical protein [Vicinamibacteria bacterium]
MWPHRRRRGRLWLVAWTLAAAGGCGGEGTSGPSASSSTLESLVPRAHTVHFDVHAGLASEATVAEIAAALESRYGRVTADLETGEVPRITVEVWSDEASFFTEMERFLGRRFSGATGYVTGPSVLRVLAVPQVARNATHEMSHAISLHVNPTFGNRPRWLWESVALYENGELVDPRSISYLVQGRFPTLTELDADPNAGRQVYEVGYLIGEFVVARAGREGLLRLIRAHGDVGVLGFASPAAFESEWTAFVRARYFAAAGLTLGEAVP